MPRSQRPFGQPTRGKTALNRLRRVDSYIALAWPQVLTSGVPLIVDVGYGAQPWTALEMAERWQRFNPRLRLIGLEIDPERVASAQPQAQPGRIDFRLGGFNVAAALGQEQARIIRAYNVLRQYEESAVAGALAAMAGALEPGGLLIEGTSTPSGGLAVFDIYQTQPDGTLRHRDLVFASNLRPMPDPVAFQAILPKRLIHHAWDARPAAFFAAWARALRLARGAGQLAPLRAWVAAAHTLRAAGYPVDARRRILRRGYLALRDTLFP